MMPRPPVLALLILAAAAACLTGPLAQEERVSVSPTVGILPSGVNLRLTFSRPVIYHVQEGRNRLTMKLREPVTEDSLLDRNMDGSILRRIRIRTAGAGSEIILHLGGRYESYSLAERQDPYQLILLLRGEQDKLPDPVDLDAPEDPLPGDDGTPAFDPGRAQRKKDGKLRTIVIDAGHGGEENGAIGPSGLKEKDLVLDIARRLKDRLSSAGYKADLTRNGDRSMDLTARTAYANSMGADLFISVHANASSRADARGAETYFLSRRASDADAWSLAEGENAPGTGAIDRAGADGGVEMVLWELAQTEHIARSSRLAEIIQNEMNALYGVLDRGVKQAPFRVLVGATMPAVLVEVGFLSNPSEELLLAGDPYRDRIAEVLARAVDRFGAEVVAAAGAGPAGGAPR